MSSDCRENHARDFSGAYELLSPEAIGWFENHDRWTPEVARVAAFFQALYDCGSLELCESFDLAFRSALFHRAVGAGAEATDLEVEALLDEDVRSVLGAWTSRAGVRRCDPDVRGAAALLGIVVRWSRGEDWWDWQFSTCTRGYEEQQRWDLGGELVHALDCHRDVFDTVWLPPGPE